MGLKNNRKAVQIGLGLDCVYIEQAGLSCDVTPIIPTSKNYIHSAYSLSFYVIPIKFYRQINGLILIRYNSIQLFLCATPLTVSFTLPYLIFSAF